MRGSVGIRKRMIRVLKWRRGSGIIRRSWSRSAGSRSSRSGHVLVYWWLVTTVIAVIHFCLSEITRACAIRIKALSTCYATAICIIGRHDNLCVCVCKCVTAKKEFSTSQFFAVLNLIFFLRSSWISTQVLLLVGSYFSIRCLWWEFHDFLKNWKLFGFGERQGALCRQEVDNLCIQEETCGTAKELLLLLLFGGSLASKTHSHCGQATESSKNVFGLMLSGTIVKATRSCHQRKKKLPKVKGTDCHTAQGEKHQPLLSSQQNITPTPTCLFACVRVRVCSVALFVLLITSQINLPFIFFRTTVNTSSNDDEIINHRLR